MKKRTRIMAFIFAIVLVVSLQSNVYGQQKVQESSKPSTWAAEGVEWSSVYELAPLDFYSKYNSKVTREELYTVCVRMYEALKGEEIKPIEKSPFTDAKSEVVLKACSINLISGKGKLEPKKEATRLEMVACMLNSVKAAQPEFDYSTKITLEFSDAKKIPATSIDEVKYAVEKEILKGKGNNTLDLGATCSRQEILVFATKVYEFSIYESKRDSKGVFWKISDEDSTVYLLGSVHVASSSMYPLSKSILEAYQKSDVLAVEIDMTNQNEILKHALKCIYINDTLENNIPKEVYDEYAKQMESYGVQKSVYNSLKPIWAAFELQNLKMAQESYKAELGIDMFFLSKAHNKKEIVEVEGMGFQMDMINSFSKQTQIEILKGMLTMDNEDTEKEEYSFEDMIKVWKEGNGEELAKIVKTEEDTEDEAMKEFNEKLWGLRDENMAVKIKEYLKDTEKRTYFVVVGAGHLVGKGGIVELLDSEYELEQIK